MTTDPEALRLPDTQAVPPEPPATAAPHRRRRWVVFTLATVLVLGLAAAGLVVWAPWIPPPVLRPAGLAAGPATANTITVRWSRPRTGPLPDKYLIISNGGVVGSVAGTATSYRQVGLTPADSYQYRVIAVRAGKRSPRSALLTVHTPTPPISAARLQGSWAVQAKPIHHRLVGIYSYEMTWQAIPGCAAGACDAKISVDNGKHPFSVKLARAGTVYQGHTVLRYTTCGPHGNSIPDPTTLRIRIHITTATGQGPVWAAQSFKGTMTGTTRYVSAATFYCPVFSYKGSLTGTESY